MDGGGVEMLSFPGTPESASVRAYLLAQANKDFSQASKFFTEDVVFNDLMYPVSGLDAVTKSLSEYADQHLTYFRVEAANEAGVPDRYLVLCFIALRGSEVHIPTCDYISLRDGKICRVDNCFDAAKLQKLFLLD